MIQSETRKEAATGIVAYAMRKGQEVLFVNHKDYPMEYTIAGDFLTGRWHIRGEYTKLEAPYCYKHMVEHLLGFCNENEAIERVVEMLKGGAIIV